MKFSCSTSDFLQSLQLVSRAIGGQQALPILGNVLLEVKGSACTVSATDLELSIITTFEASVESEGSITIPAKAILNFAQFNPDTEVVIELHEGTQLRCTSKHAKTMIAGEAASEYPTISAVDHQTSFSLGADPLLRALHLVTFAAAKTTLRPVLSGVYVRKTAEGLTFVATDSYRLSEYKLPTDPGTEDVSCIIPVKVLDELKTVLAGRGEKKGKKDGEEERRVAVSLGKQQVEIKIGNTRLLSRLIDGKFPNYEQIVPKETVTKAFFPLGEFLTAAKRMHYFAKEVNNNLTFHLSPGQCRIVTPQTPAGRDEATIGTESTENENKIALSSSYLLDFLNHIDGDNVEMRIVDSQRPAIFILTGNEKFMHLIMPLRMQEE